MIRVEKDGNYFTVDARNDIDGPLAQGFRVFLDAVKPTLSPADGDPILYAVSIFEDSGYTVTGRETRQSPNKIF